MTPLAARTQDVAARFQTAGIDADVIFGREGFTREIPQRPRVQVLYDDAGDTYEPAGSVRGTGQQALWWCFEGALAHIIGASNVNGATEDDHKAFVKALVDDFIALLLIVAHGKTNIVRNVKGAFLPPDDDAPAEYGARYDLRLELGRAVTDPRAQKAARTDLIASPQGLLVAPQTNVPNITGALASITAVSGGKATVTGLAGISPSVVGLVMSLAGASAPKNNGTFAITDYVDAATVNVANPNATAPDGFNGHLLWTIQNAELEVV